MAFHLAAKPVVAAVARPTLLLLPLLLLVVISAVAADQSASNLNTVYIATQSLYPPYIDSELSNRWWDFGGAAVVNTNRYIRLTPDLQGRVGWLWARLVLAVLLFTNSWLAADDSSRHICIEPFSSPAWMIEFEYKIHGRGVSLYGDGMAFWFTKDKGTKGFVMGSSDKWNGLGLIFDTYDNARVGYAYPYVTALLNDGTLPYSKEKDGKELEQGGCEADIRDRPWATKARVTYIRDESLLKLELNVKGWDEWTTCFSVNNVTLPNVGYFGFSAETGGLSDNHDIISISTNTLTLKGRKATTNNHPVEPQDQQADKSANYNSAYNKSSNQSRSGPSYTTIFFVILAIAGLAFAGMRYISYAKVDYKRF